MNLSIQAFLEETDAKQLTIAQRQKLSEMVGVALTEIRALNRSGRYEQAAALADAFHNVPAVMWTNHFSLAYFKRGIRSYSERFPQGYVDYLSKLEEVEDA